MDKRSLFEAPIGKTVLPRIEHTKKQGFVMNMTVEEVQWNLEFVEIEYRQFKVDVYNRMKHFEEVVADLKYILKKKQSK